MARSKTLYVSSTFVDLTEHRAALKLELERAGFDVESMERYAAFPEPPLEKCLADVAACDGYVLLVAHRYGDPATVKRLGKSVTEFEYEEALRTKKPVFAFCVDESHPWTPKLVDKGQLAKRVSALRQRVQAAHGTRTFTHADDLTKQVLAALHSHAWQRVGDRALPAVAPGSTYRWPSAWDFSAYMADKREVFEGRDWLFKLIADWQGAQHPRALLIRADFGVGKSAVMAELVHRNPGGALAAWHFCQHDTQETLQPGAFVRSLAAQFAATLPGYRELIEADSALQECLDCALTDPGSALEGAVLAPLSRLPAPATQRLMIIDALDESLELQNARASSIATGSALTVVSLLAAKASRFPPWLRVLATSRPNPLVLVPLQAAFGVKEIDAESIDNQADLRRYILGRCAREPLAGVLRCEGRAAEPLADLLVQRSQGKYLYAVRAMRDLENGRIGVAELVALPPGMDSFYLNAFERRFAHAARDYASARRVLGALAAAREPVAPALLAWVLQVGEAEVKAVHKTLPDFLRQRAGKLTCDHFSMAEWLTRDNDEGFARAGDFAVDIDASQAAWRDWALQQFDRGEAHRHDYLLRHLPAHLINNEERRRVVGTLLLENFQWLQARLDQAGVDALVADAEALPGVPELPTLVAVLRNSSHVLRQSPGMLVSQLLGRVGQGLGDELALASLAASARAWLARAENAGRCAELLLPTRRSLRLSTAHQATLEGGGAALAVLPDGRIVSGSWEGVVLLWDPAQPQQAITLEGHAGEVTALAVLPDGRIASGSTDHTVRLWDPSRKRQPVVFEGHSDRVTTLAVLPDGRIASGSQDQTVRLWDPEEPTRPVIFEGHSGWVTALTVLPDGRIASSSDDNTVRLWDPTCVHEPIVFEDHSGSVYALAVLPDGRVASGSNDNTVRLWDPVRRQQPIVLEGHSNRVTALTVLRDGRIASGSWDHSVRVWDPTRPLQPIVLEGHSNLVNCLVTLADGRIASSSFDSTVRVWNLARPQHPVVFEGHSDVVSSLAALPDGRLASGSEDNTVRLWDPAQPPLAIDFQSHAGSVAALAVLPDGRIASGSDDYAVRLWDAALPQQQPIVYEGHSTGVSALVALPDGRIASGSEDDSLRVWDPAQLQQPIVFAGHSFPVTALALLPDGRIASGSRDRTVRVWDPKMLQPPVIFEGHTQWVNALAVLADGRIVSCSDDSTVRVWDPARLQEPIVFTGHLSMVRALVVLPDGRIATGSHDRTVRLWDPARPQQGPVVFEGHTNWVLSLAVMSDGRIASGSDDRTVRLWDPAHPRQPVVVTCHSSPVTALAALPDGRIASGSDDKTVRLWDAAARVPARIFVADAAVTCIALAPGGPIVAGCADGAVHFLRLA